MEVRRQQPFGILGPYLYDFAPADGAAASDFAAGTAFASSPVQKRAETSSNWSHRFVAAANVTLLFYWTSPADKVPKGVFPLFRDSTVEYLRSFEGKDHVVILRPRPSVPSHRVIYLSMPTEAQAKSMARRMIECRPEVLSMKATMAHEEQTTARKELESAREVERARDELLAAVCTSLDRASVAAELLVELERKIEAAWHAHGSLALEDDGAAASAAAAAAGSSSSSPPRLSPLQGRAGESIHGLREALEVGAALRSRSGSTAAGRTPSPDTALAASAAAATAASPSGRRRPASSGVTAATAATASRRLFTELEARIRSSAAAASKLGETAALSERRFRRLALVNAMLANRFREYVREWGPDGGARTFGRAARRPSGALSVRSSRSPGSSPGRRRGRSDAADRLRRGSVPPAAAGGAAAAAPSAGAGAEGEASLGRARSSSAGGRVRGTRPGGAAAAAGEAEDASGYVEATGLDDLRAAAAAVAAAAAASRPQGGGGKGAPGPRTTSDAASLTVGRSSSAPLAPPPVPIGPGAATVTPAMAGAPAAAASGTAPKAAPAPSPHPSAGGAHAGTARADAAEAPTPPAKTPAVPTAALALTAEAEAELLRHLPPPPSATAEPPAAAAPRSRAGSRASASGRAGLFGSLFGRRGQAPGTAAPPTPARQSVVAAGAAPPRAPSAATPAPAPPPAEVIPREVSTRGASRYPGRIVALLMQVQQLGAATVPPSSWAYLSAKAFGRDVRTPPLQAYLDPETRRSCRLDARGPRGGYVALSFAVDRPLTDDDASLELRVVAPKPFRADADVGRCAVSLWQLQQWPNKAHAVWAELHGGDERPTTRSYEIPVPVGRDDARPDRAALGELPPPPVTGRPCVLVQLVYTVSPPGADPLKGPRVSFFDSAKARREQEEARKQVAAMSAGEERRGNAAGEVVFSDDEADDATASEPATRGRAAAADAAAAMKAAAEATARAERAEAEAATLRRQLRVLARSYKELRSASTAAKGGTAPE